MTRADTKVELLPNTDVWIRKENLTHILCSAKTPAVMARSLFKELFTVDELRSHSLNGKKCNADKTDDEPLPAVDLKRRDAIFGKMFDNFLHFILKHYYQQISIIAEFVLKQLGYEISTDKTQTKARKMAQQEINKSVADLLRTFRVMPEHKLARLLNKSTTMSAAACLLAARTPSSSSSAASSASSASYSMIDSD